MSICCKALPSHESPCSLLDLGRMAQLDDKGRSMVISLAMGLGRTKLFLALVEYHVRKLVQENESREVVAL